MKENKTESSNSIIKLIKFCILGGITYLVAVIATYFFVGIFKVQNATSYGLTQIIIFSVNFFLARKWVFLCSKQNLFKQAILYVSMALCFRFTDWLLFVVLMESIGPPKFIAIFFSIGIVFPLKFFVYDRKVFIE